MGFKRKLSSCDLSPSSDSSCSSMIETPTTPTPCNAAPWLSYTSNFSMANADLNLPTLPALNCAQPAFHDRDTHLNSRTRKRFRDNRPDESTIYGTLVLPHILYPLQSSNQAAESTISKLFLAQRPSQPCAPAPRPSSMSSSTATSTRSYQASLHSFWAIPQRPATSRSATAPPPAFSSIGTRRRCEDCDAWIGSCSMDSMDTDMGMDCETQQCCSGCGRVVCDACAVVKTGVGRECLECKTKSRRWAGAHGWVA